MERTNRRKVQQGHVIANQADKTITVLVERRLPHPIYGKFFKLSKKFLAHDPENTCNIGDFVKIIECRPLSKRKTWRLVEVITRRV